jgi:TPR repeat protein
MYYNGQGVKVNKTKAYELLLKAAKEGNSTAQENLDIVCKESPWACK